MSSIALTGRVPDGVPYVTRYTPNAMVGSVDNLATEAGVEMLRRGGNAVDAALAANAVLTVVLPNQCGLGGDLFALVHHNRERPVALNASGWTGSGADPTVLRRAGHTRMPPSGEIASVPIPGCVDGWVELQRRFSNLPLQEILEPARRYAHDGFPASPFLVQAIPKIANTAAASELAPDGTLSPGQVIQRPGMARLLAGIGSGGRENFYEGEFGQGLIRMGRGLYTEQDLSRVQAEWVTPLGMRVWGRDVWTAPPNSQGYLLLSAAWIAERLDLPTPEDPLWAHLLIEAARQAAFDRPEVLHERADGEALLSPTRLQPRLSAISRSNVADLTDRYMQGGTTYLCAVDKDGMSVSLIQSNAMSFGSGLVVEDTGVFLQNRGIGFSLEEGHPAEYGPGRRPPHTLSPVLVTNPDRSLHAVLGIRGGDSQPQVLLQLLVRLLKHDQDPAEAMAAGRWILRGTDDATSFNTWGYSGSVRTALEGQSPQSWPDALRSLGHTVEVDPSYDHPFGHAQIILSDGERLAGAADPRALSGSIGGY
ncbi:gamma-glutamyltransferase family protein [Segeticoccus rhizosphaerae]|uniref:gamma-glutamyltransferase family protein n=1 Tax=Segeticoccus rhizosphaerae TaxID=1104777 RepID=UPI001939B6F5|nr:gamma-glutamyltransferase [Segeticoccus rhizosphaerae]